MDVLLQLHDGRVTTITQAVEAEDASCHNNERFLFWEALQTKCNTIGARAALDWALRQHNTKP